MIFIKKFNGEPLPESLAEMYSSKESEPFKIEHDCLIAAILAHQVIIQGLGLEGIKIEIDCPDGKKRAADCSRGGIDDLTKNL